MAGGTGRVVGEYEFGERLGSGSFSVVWKARRRGAAAADDDVAVKEIALDNMSKKLRDGLLSEIAILRTIRHPNIIALHSTFEAPGRIFIVLEYCKGGDLSYYIRRHGRLPEATAKHFMQQLAFGLQVLRKNNIIHRDLKPQNLLLSRNDDSALLKIADFGFARSLQSQDLAETLCGSPLYMAPEIMHFQKYDAKADLWSVGAILFQLVTGRTPFNGNNQVQLLQNIMKSNKLSFPRDCTDLSSDCIDLCQKLLRRNPVERLTFEEFFNHPFLKRYPEESLRTCLSASASNDPQFDDVGDQEDHLPGIIESESKTDKRLPGSPAMEIDTPRYHASFVPECRHDMICSHKPSNGYLKENESAVVQRPMKVLLEDSLYTVVKGYVIVPGSPLEVSSSSRAQNSSCKSEISSVLSSKHCASTGPIPMSNSSAYKHGGFQNRKEDHRSSQCSGVSQLSVDMGDAVEQSSTHGLSRIWSLKQSACVLAALVKEKVELHKPLDAFSVQLVVLAIWKEALHIFHTLAASNTKQNSHHEIKFGGSTKKEEFPYSHESITNIGSQQLDDAKIEDAFLQEVKYAEELTKDLGPRDEATEMPDAMDIIYQSALSLGRNAAVEELINNMQTAAVFYSKSVQLLYFLLAEAPSLALNPPFSLTKSDKLRLRSYIDVLNNRQSQYRTQRMALLKVDEEPGP